MWTIERRYRCDRDKLRDPSDLTDAEWQLIKPLIPPAKRGAVDGYFCLWGRDGTLEEIHHALYVNALSRPSARPARRLSDRQPE
jgi:hypothetical protein